MKPIETFWKGYRFRSRLEARWAVFFENMGLDWEYEPQGYERDGRRYLPDFAVRSKGVVDCVNGATYVEGGEWATWPVVKEHCFEGGSYDGPSADGTGAIFYEIKPEWSPVCERAQSFGAIQLSGDPYNLLIERRDHRVCALCGAIGTGNEWGVEHTPLCWWDNAGDLDFIDGPMIWSCCPNCTLKPKPGDWFWSRQFATATRTRTYNGQGKYPDISYPEACFNGEDLMADRVWLSVRAARQARFEHGEAPSIECSVMGGVDLFKLRASLSAAACVKRAALNLGDERDLGAVGGIDPWNDDLEMPGYLLHEISQSPGGAMIDAGCPLDLAFRAVSTPGNESKADRDFWLKTAARYGVSVGKQIWA